jgi:hypothetical protein
MRPDYWLRFGEAVDKRHGQFEYKVHVFALDDRRYGTYVGGLAGWGRGVNKDEELCR